MATLMVWHSSVKTELGGQSMTLTGQSQIVQFPADSWDICTQIKVYILVHINVD